MSTTPQASGPANFCAGITGRPRSKSWHAGDTPQHVVTSSLNQALEQRRHAVAVLETYVPRLVLQEINGHASELDGANPLEKEMIGVCAFVDMSGFSTLCEYLHHHSKNQHDVTASSGLEGSEYAKDMLCGYFGPVMRRFMDFGGDIVKVAGDAVVVVWPCSQPKGLPLMVQHVCSACKVVASEFFHVQMLGFTLSLHIGIGAGLIKLLLIGGKGDRWFHIVIGDAVSQSIHALDPTKSGEVAVSKQIWDHLENSGAGFSSLKINQDGFNDVFLLTDFPIFEPATPGRWRSNSSENSPVPNETGAALAFGENNKDSDGEEPMLVVKIRESIKLDTSSASPPASARSPTSLSLGGGGGYFCGAQDHVFQRDNFSEGNSFTSNNSPFKNENGSTINNVFQASNSLVWPSFNGQTIEEAGSTPGSGDSNNGDNSNSSNNNNVSKNFIPIGGGGGGSSNLRVQTLNLNGNSSNNNANNSNGYLSGLTMVERDRIPLATPDSVRIKAAETAAAWKKHFDRHAMNMSVAVGDVSSLASRERWLHSLVNPAVLSHLQTSGDPSTAALRHVSVLFMNMPGGILASAALEDTHSLVSTIQATVVQYSGNIKECSLDDKGFVLVVGFGVPPQARCDDAALACKTALDLRRKLLARGLDPTFGITTGDLFCGSIGCDKRYEYSLVGSVVNLAARLMIAAKKTNVGILADSATQQATRDTFSWIERPPIPLKGIEGLFTPFELVDRKSDEDNLEDVVILGRESEASLLRDFVQESLERKQGLLAMIEGDHGHGKTAMLRSVITFSKEFSNDCKVFSLNGASRTCWATILSDICGGSLSFGVDSLSCLRDLLAIAYRRFYSIPSAVDACDTIVSLLVDEFESDDDKEAAQTALLAIFCLLTAAFGRNRPKRGEELEFEITGEEEPDGYWPVFVVDGAHFLSERGWYLIEFLSMRATVIVALEPHFFGSVSRTRSLAHTSWGPASVLMNPLADAAKIEYEKLRRRSTRWYRTEQGTMRPRTQSFMNFGLAALLANPTAESPRQNKAISIELVGFRISEAQRIISRWCETTECSEEVAKFLVERTRGTPKFLLDWLNSLKGCGAIVITRSAIPNRFNTGFTPRPPAENMSPSIGSLNGREGNGPSHRCSVQFAPGVNYGLFPRAPHAVVSMISAWIDSLVPHLATIVRIASVIGRDIPLTAVQDLCTHEIDAWQLISEEERASLLMQHMRTLCGMDMLEEYNPPLSPPQASFEERQWVHWMMAELHWARLLGFCEPGVDETNPVAVVEALASMLRLRSGQPEAIDAFAQHINHCALAQERGRVLRLLAAAPRGLINSYCVRETCEAFQIESTDISALKSYMPLVPWIKGLYSLGTMDGGGGKANVELTSNHTTRLQPRKYFTERSQAAKMRRMSANKKRLHLVIPSALEQEKLGSSSPYASGGGDDPLNSTQHSLGRLQQWMPLSAKVIPSQSSPHSPWSLVSPHSGGTSINNDSPPPPSSAGKNSNNNHNHNHNSNNNNNNSIISNIAKQTHHNTNAHPLLFLGSSARSDQGSDESDEENDMGSGASDEQEGLWANFGSPQTPTKMFSVTVLPHVIDEGNSPLEWN